MTAPGSAAFDLWTVVHVGAGVALGAARLPWWVALGAMIGFELVEAGLRTARPGGAGVFEHESARNVIVDLAAGAAGYALSRAVAR